MRKALKEARAAKGLSVSELAGMLGVSPSIYYKWESGSRAPLLENARHIACILGKTIEELFFAYEQEAN
ncbi:MAG TPA: helix-turn-helix domain-containing protein [Syntrophomonadaceae bacterium]|nr:helix-turn-helix domain-containing protein [Syntrophomonadaceae bacterium]